MATAAERAKAHYHRHIDKNRQAARDRYATQTEEQLERRRARDRARYARRGATARAEVREKGRRRRWLTPPRSYGKLVSALSSWSNREYLHVMDGERARAAMADHDEWLLSIDAESDSEEEALTQ